MARLIARHLDPIPSAIFKLFKAVIKARSITASAFERIVSEKPDPEIERANATHKHFIDALTQAFHALGGRSWDSGRALFPESEDEVEDEDEDVATLQNQFSSLSLGKAEEGDVDGDDGYEDDDALHAHIPPAKQQSRPRKKKCAKGKKGKRSQKPTAKATSGPAAAPPLSDLPIESYRIIEDQDGLVSDYLMAVYAVVQEWMELRSYTQDLWHKVAYEGLNSAVAATLTNNAVAMVKQTCIAVFAEFPGHESYETITQTITRGDIERAQQQFSLDLYRMMDSGRPEKVRHTYLDAKESFWVHTYNDLLAFIADFQKNRGKPTKAMQAQLNQWDPNRDLQRATNDERIQWRRLYTINWLYDLVNVFSSSGVQRNTMKGERHVLENVDWSPSGPWNHHRRLFGLNEFAGDITSFAMQKPIADIKGKIFPHHAPPRHFFPRRDVDFFLDREAKRFGPDNNQGPGVLQSIEILEEMLEKDATEQRGSSKHVLARTLFGEIKFDFVNWLGESKYMYGLNTIAPSRFSKYNANGLWEYSPLLCGAGLVEGIILIQRLSMLMWDEMPEPTLLLHMQNMLVKKGLLDREIGLYDSLEQLLPGTFFQDKVPNESFLETLNQRVSQGQGQSAFLHRRRRAEAQKESSDVHRLLDLNFNRFFTVKSELMKHFDAGWVPHRIPDREVKIPSLLYAARLEQTERIVDPATGDEKLKDTELVQRSRAEGHPEKFLLRMSSVSLDASEPAREEIEAINMSSSLKDDIPAPGPPPPDPYALQDKTRRRSNPQGSVLLEHLRADIFSDVCGQHPLSALNLIWITVHMLVLFSTIEDKFRTAQDPLWKDIYERRSTLPRDQKRVRLVVAAMASEEPRALKTLTDAFEKTRTGVMHHIWWPELRVEESGTREKGEGDVPSDCSVM
ncbi:hypothetical protein KC340_g14431 [Hortaea werneckii]|nr:hypothetical protein KC339_g6628 [Hortaea werneckii]KAI7207566.1 hypothetical protein KC365_g16490 [Hortaea werneckii]KAI7298269.1 hypothetical protein KC340_g14431 [Hortaea werneckii]